MSIPSKKSSSSKKTKQNEILPRKALMERLQYLGQMASTETAYFHQSAASKNGVTITDSKTISALMQEGQMTAGQLAKRLSLTTGAVTSVIDRLEKANLVHRVADPRDRRKVWVTVNLTTVEKMGESYQSMGKSFHQLLHKYSVEELQFLIDYYQASIELIKQEIAKLAI